VRITEIETNELGQLAKHKATFLPPKEILSVFDAIVATRETAEIASFDDTYYDLVTLCSTCARRLRAAWWERSRA
jgi:hypothetical protein